jgi:hypothetical protein
MRMFAECYRRRLDNPAMPTDECMKGLCVPMMAVFDGYGLSVFVFFSRKSTNLCADNGQ